MAGDRPSKYFLHLKSASSMSDLADALLPKLGMPIVWKHESLNYPPDGVYFSGKSDGVECRLSAEDDGRYADYQYRLTIIERFQRERALSFVGDVLRQEGYDFEIEQK
jgi:hypothetical protein